MNRVGFMQAQLLLSPKEYDLLRGFLSKKTGIDLGENKQSLVESRLLNRLHRLNCTSYSEYIDILRSNTGEISHFINSMTTNKTNWFREPAHFQFLNEVVVPAFLRTCNRPIYVWSAASSTGEEIYTLSMVLSEHQHLGLDFRILGTDVDTQVLETARNGLYRGIAVREEVPPHFVAKYFDPSSISERGDLKVVDRLLEKVKFRQFNLISSTLPEQMKFDVIFLRNVLIYFKTNTIEIVINTLCNYLKPGGYLFIGHSETLNRTQHSLVSVGPSIFRKPG